ncbi:hypothetical protein PPL_05640 [Heterostelium album PN500]|uniref:Uncharacterized protein n=1 Tax=Heterostelium pallidum (strain ATCC 26659 / Pp 5 / PN500) TaxID=670386 RepID=D3BAR0_HETP5|nr:hypothetical protein PPL_05640 [Heterostelium album PN500]EFA81647.1 hypothetical protein PPL_05640 [Heterostelium album PN500]|eukprot:XP_020433764.1 hypothetical protein PPL_05640 [Heterostelium album PN500]
MSVVSFFIFYTSFVSANNNNNDRYSSSSSSNSNDINNNNNNKQENKSIDSVNKYLCNVNPTYNTSFTCQPFTPSSNIRNCTHINDCINAINGLGLSQIDILNINIFGSRYSGPENCGDIAGQIGVCRTGGRLLGATIVHLTYTLEYTDRFDVDSECLRLVHQRTGQLQHVHSDDLKLHLSELLRSVWWRHPADLSKLTECAAVHSGGAIYSDGTTIVSSDFLSNVAERGGAIFSPVFTTSELLVNQTESAAFERRRIRWCHLLVGVPDQLLDIPRQHRHWLWWRRLLGNH